MFYDTRSNKISKVSQLSLVIIEHNHRIIIRIIRGSSQKLNSLLLLVTICKMARGSLYLMIA